MSTKDTGGQAFPCHERGGAGAGPLDLTDPGMTLRDYFAAKAMQVDYRMAKEFGDPDWRVGIAIDAYTMADAMLKARQA